MGRRVGAWMVAAAVTVALVAGGVWVAGGGPDRSPAVLPALDLGAAGAAGDATAAANADAAGAAEPAPARAGATEPAKPGAGAPQLWPPVTYRLRGSLPDLPDQARAWKVGADPGADRVADLAAALGLPGQPREDPGGWTVADGRRSLTVNRLGGAPWTYATGLLPACTARPGGPRRPGPGIQCLDPDAPVSNRSGPAAGSAAGGSGAAGGGSAANPGSAGGRPVPPVTVKPLAPARPWRPADPPTRAEAERVARDLAAKAGLDLDGAAVRVTDAYAARVVTIAPAVGGLPTAGFAWRVTVGDKGRIQHASGYLATPEPADTYPLIGEQEAFERLKRTPPLGPVLRADVPAMELDPCPPGAKVPCAAKPLPAKVATVTGVRLGLQLAPALAAQGARPGGLAYLLPAYLFDLEGGWTDVRPIVAVPDRYLTRP